jgi:hypothetical protein
MTQKMRFTCWPFSAECGFKCLELGLLTEHVRSDHAGKEEEEEELLPVDVVAISPADGPNLGSAAGDNGDGESMVVNLCLRCRCCPTASPSVLR